MPTNNLNKVRSVQQIKDIALRLAEKDLADGSQPPSKEMKGALSEVCTMLESRSGGDASMASLVSAVRRVVAR